jgi:DsbC/DsbD-like thiol-disulfide interchange protein
MIQNSPARFLPNLLAAFLLCLATVPANAADASPWNRDTRSAVRLIGASAQHDSNGAVFRAGIEIELEPGWKTYWRYPGDAGVPPVFDFAGSDNVKSATVLWPAPVRFEDGGGMSIGYKGSVIFPLRIVPQDPAKPVRLQLNLDYAVCETLCIPAKGKAELALTGKAGAQERALREAETRVPQQRPVGDRGALSVRKVWRDGSSGRPRVIAEVAAPVPGKVDLFAEGPTAEWALPLPAPVQGGEPGTKRFAFELDGLPPGEKPDGASIRLTATAGNEAVETVFRLD